MIYHRYHIPELVYDIFDIPELEKAAGIRVPPARKVYSLHIHRLLAVGSLQYLSSVCENNIALYEFESRRPEYLEKTYGVI
jgi:hypothetical protein